MRSLIPSTIHVMALTATATQSVWIAVTNIVGLRNPFVITRCPARSNLIYSVGLFMYRARYVDLLFYVLVLHLYFLLHHLQYHNCLLHAGITET